MAIPESGLASVLAAERESPEGGSWSRAGDDALGKRKGRDECNSVMKIAMPEIKMPGKERLQHWRKELPFYMLITIVGFVQVLIPAQIRTHHTRAHR